MTVLCKSYPAVAEALLSVRHSLAALASSLGADQDAIERVRLAASEAASSLIQRARGEGAQLHVRVAQLDERALAVVMCCDAPESSHAENGQAPDPLGFMVIRSCADALNIGRSDTGAIEIRMRFALGSGGSMPSTTPLPGASQFAGADARRDGGITFQHAA